MKIRKLLMVLSFLLLQFSVHAQEKTVVNPTELEILLKNTDLIVIDVRTPEEFNEGHLENALNIDWLADDFLENIKKVDREDQLVIYCGSGIRSSRAIRKMEGVNFKTIYELDGGINRWREESHKVVK